MSSGPWGPAHQYPPRPDWGRWVRFGVLLLLVLSLGRGSMFGLVVLVGVGYGCWRLVAYALRGGRVHGWRLQRSPMAGPGLRSRGAEGPAGGLPSAGVFLGLDSLARVRASRPERAVLLIGPPRSGKTSAVIIPTLWRHFVPAVCTSTKPDVLEATWARRTTLGRVWSFDPTGSTQSPAGVQQLRWSPLRCSADWDGALLMARAMVADASVGTGTTDATHWAKRAQALLTGVLHAAAVGGVGVGELVRWVFTHDLETPLGLLDEHQGSPLAAMTLKGLWETDGRERSAIFSATSDALDAYTSQGALDASTDPNFDAARFVRSQETVFVHAPAESQRLVAPLVCGLLAEIRRETYRAHAAGRLQRRVLFALDEVANIAPITELPQIASEGGGQGLLLLAVLQDLSQARGRWGSAADGFLTLFGTKLILPGVADTHTLEAVSVALGEYDRQLVSESRGRQPKSLGAQRSHTVSTQRQRVLSPGEIANLPAGHGLHLDGVRWELLTLAPHHQTAATDADADFGV